MAAPAGLEPAPAESKSDILPLDERAIWQPLQDLNLHRRNQNPVSCQLDERAILVISARLELSISGVKVPCPTP